MKLLTLLLSIGAALASQAEVKVASLHPLMGDLARQVGGDRVTVVDIGKVGMNVHSFAPTPKDLKAIGSCQLVIASGKGLETYLSSLEDSLGGIPIFEVGEFVPSISIAEGDLVHACCPHDADHSDHDHSDHSDHAEHSEEAIDPHWWHDVSNMERAVKVVEKQLTQLDPEGKEYYQSRSKETRESFQELDRWVKAQIATLPLSQRKLVTAHAAFGYFCKAYGMTPVFVLGLSGDHELSAKQLAEEVTKLQEEGVKAVFPEKVHNPKVLAQISKQMGVELGDALVADGAVASYESMVKSNVTAIVQGLAN